MQNQNVQKNDKMLKCQLFHILLMYILNFEYINFQIKKKKFYIIIT